MYEDIDPVGVVGTIERELEENMSAMRNDMCSDISTWLSTSKSWERGMVVVSV